MSESGYHWSTADNSLDGTSAFRATLLFSKLISHFNVSSSSLLTKSKVGDMLLLYLDVSVNAINMIILREGEKETSVNYMYVGTML